MFCSTCGAPISSAADPCPSCGAAPASVADSSNLVTVLETADASRLAISKSILDGAEIPYLVQGEDVLGLFPLGAFGSSFFGRAVAARIRVATAHAEEAAALLDLPEDDDLSGDGEDADDRVDGAEPDDR